MAWKTYKKDCLVPLRAEENIPIIKVCEYDQNGRLLSPVYPKPYHFNKKYHSEIDNPEETIFEDETIGYIDKGLHSFNKNKVNLDESYFNGDFIVVKYTAGNDTAYIVETHKFHIPVFVEGYIPVGSTYYENEYGDIVSNAIVLTHEIH